MIAVAAVMNSHPNASFIQVRGRALSRISRSIDVPPSSRVSGCIGRNLTEPTTELLGHHLLPCVLGRFARSPLRGSDSEACAVPTSGGATSALVELVRMEGGKVSISRPSRADTFFRRENPSGPRHVSQAQQP